MERWILSFFLGVILSFFSPIVPAISYKTLLLLLFLAFLLFKKGRILIAFALGLLWSLCTAFQLQNIWLDNQLAPEKVYNQALDATIAVASIITEQEPERDGSVRGNYFYGHLLAINHHRLDNPIKVRLSGQDVGDIKQGHVINTKVKLKPSHSFSNPGTFNYKTWLMSKQVVVTGYILPKAKRQVLSVHTSLRQQWYDLYQQQLADNPVAPLILALTFGERALFTDRIWAVLGKTGTQHLMAISGLHIGLVAGMAYLTLLGAVRFLPWFMVGTRIQGAVLTCNFQPLLLLGSLAVALFYAYLADFSIPTLRAIIMLSVFIIAKLCHVHLSITRLILISLFFIILFDPLSVLSVSFWLSFSAVSTIIFLTWRFRTGFDRGKGWKKYVTSLLLIQVGLSILMLPINGYLFGSVSIVAIAANLIAVPIVGLVVMPLLLVSLVLLPLHVPFAYWFVERGAEVFNGLWLMLQGLAELEYANQTISFNTQLLLIGAVFIVLLLLLTPLKIKVKSMLQYASMIVLTMGAFAFKLDKQPVWEVAVLDVGQGLSVVIIMDGQAILYDTGASYKTGFNLVEAVVLPYLHARHIHQLDYVFISHSDNDHAGGLDKLLEHHTIERLIMNSSPPFNSIDKEACIKGKQWHWQGLTILALHPNDEVGKGNDDSCVLLISDGDKQVLLTGDISIKIESLLVQHPLKQAVDVLVAPHHGSKTSSSADFIRWSSPKYAVFSTGFMNRWRMPNAAVEQRYQALGVSTFNTAESGMIKFKMSTSAVEIIEYRDDSKSYWFAN